ncbi:MAG TPA: outer membrane lipoprotein-sorting protein [Candidatus Binatia bacterium]|nr:outer membrane lipoprotein-sorting protein [Candidatus Binatia bacterium]
MLPLALVLGFVTYLCSAQPKNPSPPPLPLDPAEGERQARALLANLLTQKPDQNMTNTGVLRIRDAGRHEREVPVRFGILITPTNWLNTYAAEPTKDAPGERLTIIHTDAQQDQYWMQPFGGAAPSNAPPARLTGCQLMAPFAGSDFWLVDLGLEFLHWPQQRVLKKEMRKDLFCDVLQSTNPQPAPGAYARVVSWIAVNRPDDIVIVHADAYDSANKLLKEFNPRKVEKINGVWQLEEMEIRNRQTGSRTRIQFNLER